MTDVFARFRFASATAASLLVAGAVFAQDTPDAAEAPAPAAESAPPAIDMSELSYALGFKFGNDLRGQGVNGLDQGRLAEGVTDGATGSPPEMEPSKIAGYLVVYERGLMQRQIQVLQMQIERAKESGDASQQAFLEERLRQQVANVQRLEQMIFNTQMGQRFFAELSTREGVMAGENGLFYEVLEEGTGEAPVEGDTVEVHYVGTLIDDDKTEFDSSYAKGEPATFTIAPGEVIAGWVQGMQLVKPGGKIKLYVPPQLGYGPRGTATIPPNATLVFEVELLAVNP
ncbi:MAG: FKBP-type peptidyl-prolyl cis-trans isomerase [Planctomycetota bacterium]